MEFNLSHKRREIYMMLCDNFSHVDPFKVNEIIDKIIEQDKEFIRLLKEEFATQDEAEIIDKLAGDKLK